MFAMFAVFVLLGLAAAAPATEERERQTKQFLPSNPNCPNYFQLNTNPCQSGQGRVYYAVNGDPTKFVQCDVLGRAYVVQCPTGLYYNAATTSCQAQTFQTTQPPIVGPCTAQALQTGQLYYPYPGDTTRFYECIGLGQSQLLQCPNNLVWDSSRIACIYAPTGTGSIIANPNLFPGGTNLQFNNPCTAQQIAGHHYYFAHPDPTKFIQCDDAGQAFVVACPSGLVWNQYYETCGSAFAQTFGTVVGK